MEGQPVALPPGQLPLPSQPLCLAGSRPGLGHPTGSGTQPQTTGVPAGSAQRGDILWLVQRFLCSPRDGCFGKRHAQGVLTPLLLWWCNLGWSRAALIHTPGASCLHPRVPSAGQKEVSGEAETVAASLPAPNRGAQLWGVRTACTWPPRHQEQALHVLRRGGLPKP